MKRIIGFDADHDLFRSSFRQFIDKEMTPRFEGWERDGIVDRDLFTRAGDAGFLGMDVPDEFGGGGVKDFRYQMIITEELQASGTFPAGVGITLHNDVCMPYFTDLTTAEQRERWLPGMCSGEVITAVAMTEPGAGSDLAGIGTTARRDGDHYVVNGSKTFITNGINADLIITAVKTDPSQRHRGMTLLALERGMPGLERGRNLGKVGLHAQDTAELFFDDVPVPVANRLGEEGAGFRHLVRNLPQERMSIAVAGMSAARAALDLAVAYAKDRRAFGQPIGSFQWNRMKLAELATEVEVAQTFVDRCILDLNAGELTAEAAAMAKWWTTELQGRAVDLGVQLHGGYGYMTEYAIARAYADARVSRIYGGTTEIMKEIIGKSLGL